ncbi:GRIP-related arf-binding domain-containing protein [Sarocladium implicatum]|nr:GRIP-related arf-binding domain-containing protein [Sarocladium implicatum]
MSSTAAADPTQGSNSTSKKKNNKKKKNANKNKDAAQAGNGDAKPDNDDADEEPPTPTQAETPGHAPSEGNVTAPASSNGHAVAPEPANESSDETTAKLEAMGKDREALRAEVEQLRIQLESIQESHKKEVDQLQTDLEESNAAKDTAEEQYQTLLGRVEKIKETLSDRLKRDKAELEEAKERIEELETQNEELRGSAQSTGGDVEKLREELQDATRELSTLRSRNNLSAQNWGKEKDELARTVQHLKQELESTSNAMGEWEVIAMEERSVKESMQDKVSELEDQVASLRQGYESAASDRDSQNTLVENLQNALREIQDARKRELREMVETTEEQLGRQKELVQHAETRAKEAEEAMGELKTEFERTAPFEKEVKEKNLLIGKLRHEAIVLNDHLTKALRYLKKTKPEENVDRQVVTNHLLQFLTLDRSDAKRFQVLQIMAGYLAWTDEEREKAGLARPGGGGGGSSLRLPISPFSRTPSSPSLNADLFSEPTPSGKDKESLAELWAGFLERSAAEQAAPGPGGSRKGSVSSAATNEKRPDLGA